VSGNGDEFPEFGDVTSILRNGPSDVTDETPPPALWERIEAELASGSPVTTLADRRARRGIAGPIVVGIAAALLLVALPLGLAWRSSTGEPDRTVELAALDAFVGAGSAELDGRELRVETTGLVQEEGSSYELWLLDLDNGELSGLVSLGFIEADGTYVIDDDVDLDEFSVVDISVEPNDGNPEHSGNSVLRGELVA